jgi:hypothetical protein
MENFRLMTRMGSGYQSLGFLARLEFERLIVELELKRMSNCKSVGNKVQ